MSKKKMVRSPGRIAVFSDAPAIGQCWPISIFEK
jgi:hypothetical protein